MKQNSIASGISWKLIERFSVQVIRFALQIVLARILDPEHYGSLTLMVVFTTLANVFIQKGFSSSLIQDKHVTEEDYSTVFWVTLGIAGIAYGVIWAAAPAISQFYRQPELETPLRVLALLLFPGALNSVQQSKASREMNFRKVFFTNVGGVVTAGAVSIAMAYMGFGLWALVVQSVSAPPCPACCCVWFPAGRSDWCATGSGLERCFPTAGSCWCRSCWTPFTRTFTAW